jgi:hypothetical protein
MLKRIVAPLECGDSSPLFFPSFFLSFLSRLTSRITDKESPKGKESDDESCALQG